MHSLNASSLGLTKNPAEILNLFIQKQNINTMNMVSVQESNTETVLIQIMHIILNAAGLKQLRPRTSMDRATRTSGMILIV